MSVFIQKGDAPLTAAQAINRGLAMFESERAQWQREAGMLVGDQGYLEWANQWLADNAINEAHNRFNNQLAAVRAARARLAQYIVSEGRPEIREMQETGETDPETGEPILAEVVTQAAIEPLPPMVAGADDEGNAVEVRNPAIVADEAERSAAEATLAAMPAEVLGFDGP